MDVIVVLINGVLFILISIGCFLLGQVQVKNKIKCVDCLLGNEFFYCDILLIFNNIIVMLIWKLFLCVVVVDWSGYYLYEYYIFWVSLICDGCFIFLLSQIVLLVEQQSE